VNYLRCHDDIGWGLNEEFGKTIGQDPLAHKKFLYTFFDGSCPGSYARGERYNYVPKMPGSAAPPPACAVLGRG